jgi:hypothetical protein
MRANSNTKVIGFTRPTFTRFKAEYEKQIKDGAKFEDQFTFDGRGFVVGYAKYLIEYLEERFKGR